MSPNYPVPCYPTVLNEVSTLTVKTTLLTLSSFWRFDRFCSCSFNKEWIRPSCWLWHRLSFRWNHGEICDVANLNKLQLTTFNLFLWKILSRFLGIWYRFIPAVPTRVLSFKLRIPSQMLISSLILGIEPAVEVRNDYSWGQVWDCRSASYYKTFGQITLGATWISLIL
jgi:hypothetical protein